MTHDKSQMERHLKNKALMKCNNIQCYCESAEYNFYIAFVFVLEVERSFVNAGVKVPSRIMRFIEPFHHTYELFYDVVKE